MRLKLPKLTASRAPKGASARRPAKAVRNTALLAGAGVLGALLPPTPPPAPNVFHGGPAPSPATPAAPHPKSEHSFEREAPKRAHDPVKIARPVPKKGGAPKKPTVRAPAREVKRTLSRSQLQEAAQLATHAFFYRPRPVSPEALKAAEVAAKRVKDAGGSDAKAKEAARKAALKAYDTLAQRQGVTAAQILQLMPALRPTPVPGHPEWPSVQEDLPALNRAMLKFDLNTPNRQRAFLSQVAVETAWGDTKKEYGQDFSKYDNRSDLGNGPGDGNLFPGGGDIQLTGRTNYQKASEYLGKDFIHDPKSVWQSDNAADTAAWFFAVYAQLLPAADRGDIDTVSQDINGGSQSRAERWAGWAKALNVIPDRKMKG